MTTTEARCGRCGNTESAHEGGSPEETEIMLALIGCHGFAASRAAVQAARATVPRRAPLCGRCLQRGHETGACPW